MTRPTATTLRALAGALALAALAPAHAATIDLGDPSVMSQRGQRLKLAVPYGSSPGERVSIARFEVVSVQAPAGYAAPDPAAFSFAKPERRNLVLVESREPVDAPELTLAVRVIGEPDSAQSWRIAVPPARMAPDASVAPPPAARAPAAERAARRVPTRPAAVVR